MRTPIFSRTAGLLCLMAWAGSAAASESATADVDLAKTPLKATAVYPYDALFNKQHGTVVVDCLVDANGKLVNAAVTKTDGAEFSGAALACVDAADFSKVPRAAMPGLDNIRAPLTVEFDESKCGGPEKSMACPSESAMKIMAELRQDPSGKQFSTAKMLDEKLEPIARTAPIFPPQLQDKVESGRALIEFYIDAAGQAQLPRIVSASDPAFGYAACQSIVTWRFKPPMRDGKPTIVKVRIPVLFSLKETAQ